MKLLSGPMKPYAGPCDAIYHDGHYFVFYGDLKFDLKTSRAGSDRETPYAPGGRSQTGLASVSVQAFLEWCGHD